MSKLKKVRRSLASAALLAMAGTLGFTAPASAQDELKVSVELSEATMREMKEQGSVSLDQLRKNGLEVTVEGRADVQLLVFAFAIREG